jgi:hypothetical protein
MAQIDWMVTGNRGSRFRIGLYHGDQSGHVLMYCNNRIITIDFGVLSAKTYTLFLDDELCEVHIEPRPDAAGYDYTCSVNTEAATPLNEMRRTRKKQERRGMAIFVGFLAIAAVSIGLFVSMAHGNSAPPPDRVDLAADYGELTEASFYTNSRNGKLYYNYVVDDRIYRVSAAVIDPADLPSLPLAAGDRFALRYDPRQPRVARVLFDRYDTEQAARWRERLATQYAAEHPELTAGQVRCHLDAAHTIGGEAAYLTLGAEAAAIRAGDDDPRYRAYWRLVRAPEFRRAVAACL